MVFLNPIYRYHPPVGFFSIMVGVDMWLLVGLYLTNKLVVVEGRSIEYNKSEITKVLTQKYPEIKFVFSNPLMIRGEKPEGWAQRGKIITVLLDESDLYINILSTFRGGSFSFPNGLTNYLRSKSIARSFKML